MVSAALPQAERVLSLPETRDLLSRGFDVATDLVQLRDVERLAHLHGVADYLDLLRPAVARVVCSANELTDTLKPSSEGFQKFGELLLGLVAVDPKFPLLAALLFVCHARNPAVMCLQNLSRMMPATS